MSKPTKKLSRVDFLEIRLRSVEEALARKNLENSDLKQQNINITQALQNEQRKGLIKDYEKAEQQLAKMVDLLKSKYGVSDERQVDWSTGEIRKTQTTEEEAREEGAVEGDTSRDGD